MLDAVQAMPLGPVGDEVHRRRTLDLMADELLCREPEISWRYLRIGRGLDETAVFRPVIRGCGRGYQPGPQYTGTQNPA